MKKLLMAALTVSVLGGLLATASAQDYGYHRDYDSHRYSSYGSGYRNGDRMNYGDYRSSYREREEARMRRYREERRERRIREERRERWRHERRERRWRDHNDYGDRW